MNQTTKHPLAAVDAPIPNRPVRFLVYVTRPHIWWAVAATVSAATAAFISQASNIYFKWITDAVQSGNHSAAMWFGLSYPLVLLAIQSTYRLSGWMGMLWVVRAQKETSDVLFNYATRHSHSYFVDRFAGSLLNKIGNVVGAMDSFITGFLWSHLNAAVQFITTFVLMFTVNITAAALFAAMVSVLLFFNYRWMEPKRALSKQNAEAGTTLRGMVVDTFSNIAAVRQFAQVHSEQQRQGELSRVWIDRRRKNWMFTERTLMYNGLLLAVFGMAMFYVLVGRWQAGAITTGDFLFVIAMISQLSGTIIFIGQSLANTAKASGEALEGLEDILQPYEIVDAPGARALAVAHGGIEWHDVTFRYNNNAVFDHFRLTIAPGQRVGLVGPSGAGKTTFVSLLLRQHELNDGQIVIDGQDIAQVTQDSLRDAIAVVPQEPILFHRSIRENIAYGKPDATEEEIVAVAKLAQAHDFIAALPEGYDTLVGERGIKLSGGQKQRVAIARAMLKDAPILVLDEATSALDSESEVAIQKALQELMKGKTVIAIAHRLSTLREMDRILVLDQGSIIEDGDHSTLTQAGGVYQRLWEHQAGGFLQE